MSTKSKQILIIGLMALLPLLIFGRLIWVRAREVHRQKQEAYWRVHTWPAETEATKAQVKARQAVNETHDPTIINLRPFINTKLTDAPFNKKGINSNNLEEMPAGTNIYAGVPFDVEGSVELMGYCLNTWGKKYPTEVDSIPINRKCSKIYLLHGACFVETKDFGTTVAKLVLHYKDGNTKTLDMITGQQVFEWWGVTYHTGTPASWWTRAPGTEIAWIGSNQWLRKFKMEDEALICIYRSSFDNPQPGVELTSVDYVSTMTKTCPFMVGLTVD